MIPTFFKLPKWRRSKTKPKLMCCWLVVLVYEFTKHKKKRHRFTGPWPVSLLKQCRDLVGAIGPSQRSRRKIAIGVMWCHWQMDQESPIQVQGQLKKISWLDSLEVWAQSHVPLQMVSGDDSWSKPENTITPLKRCIQSRSLSHSGQWSITVGQILPFFLWKEPWMLCNQLQGRTCG